MATLEAARTEIPLAPNKDAPQLRVLTCGSVDDGKSTLLGRLLFDAQAVLDDQLSALDHDSRRWGTSGAARDYALLLDGLSAEREQGITIDVAYRYFSTQRRSFIVADTPGHEQYTSNMATGASQADLAIILIDARRGVLAQTRRHAYIAATLGIRHAVLAINKMDLVGFADDRYQAIVDAFRDVAAPLGFVSIVPVPLCARDGDNVVQRSTRMPWYDGPTLLDHLETVDTSAATATEAVLLPVQLVLRPDADFRGYAGTIAGGRLEVGDPVVVLPGGRFSTVARIIGADGERSSADSGEAVTLTLATEIDVIRGDVLAAAGDAPGATTHLDATLLWMADAALVPARDYLLQLGPATAGARIAVRYSVDVERYARRKATTLGMNEIGAVEITLDRALLALPYGRSRALGAFILVDRTTNQTVALGVVDRAAAVTRRPWPRVHRSIARALLGGGVMAVLAGALSRDLVLASGLGLADMLLYPVLNWVVRQSR